MKAILLAAGFGTRLRPLTDTTPKCLVPINDIPLLEWWFRLFEKHGITDVLINTHYLSDQVRNYIAIHNASGSKVKAFEFYEKELLGSGGTIAANIDFLQNDKDFLICYADNLTNIDLSQLITNHFLNNPILTMALFRTTVPEQCGIAKLNNDHLIIEFVEKPKHPKSNLANAGIYVASNEIFNYFPKDTNSDFGKDILPKLVNKMYGFEIHDYLIDVGTPDKYQRAQIEWPAVNKV